MKNERQLKKKKIFFIFGHPNNLPSTEQATKTQSKQGKFFCLSFFIVFNRVSVLKCRFGAWQKGFLRKFAYCVSVLK